VAVALLVAIAACATVPITGRSQLSLISDQAIRAMADRHYYDLLAQFNKQNSILRGSESSDAREVVDFVTRVSNKVIDASGLRYSQLWETIVLKGSARNAFVLPNGKIFIVSGLLSVTQTEAGLAAVIGHEIGHVLARHQAERVSQVLLVQATIAAAEIAVAARAPQYRPLVGAALGLGAVYGVLRPFNRTHELEADRLGLVFMAKAGYDPSEAVGVWQRMEAVSTSGPLSFLSTHPSHTARAAEIQRHLPEAQHYYALARQSQPQFARSTSPPGAVAERPTTPSPGTPLPRTIPAPPVVAALTPPSASLAPATREGVSKASLVAFAPHLRPGFWTRTRQVQDGGKQTTLRLDRSEPCEPVDCWVFTSEDGSANVFTRELALKEIRNADGSVARFSPPLRQYEWPLRPGKRWNHTIVIHRSSGAIERTFVEVRRDRDIALVEEGVKLLRHQQSVLQMVTARTEIRLNMCRV